MTPIATNDANAFETIANHNQKTRYKNNLQLITKTHPFAEMQSIIFSLYSFAFKSVWDPQNKNTNILVMITWDNEYLTNL